MRRLILTVWVLAVLPLSAEAPKAELCQRLYIHEYKLLKEADLLTGSLIDSAGQSNQNASVAAKSVQECIRSRPTGQINCRLAAGSLTAYLACNETSTATSEPAGTVVTESVGEAENIKTDKKKSLADRASCLKAYDSILKAFEKSDVLKSRQDKEKLLNHWKSSTAKQKFIQRCTSAFEPEDAICLQRSGTHTDVQKCLATIPAER